MLIALDPRELEQRCLRHAGLLHPPGGIELDGKAQRVLPRDVQFHPVTDQPLHVDFMRVADGRAGHASRCRCASSNEEPVARPQARRRAQHRAPRDRGAAAGRRDPAARSSRPGRPRTSAIRSTSAQIELPAGVRPTITDRDFTVATIAAPTVRPRRTEARGGRRRAGAEGAAGAAPAAPAPRRGGRQKPAPRVRPPARHLPRGVTTRRCAASGSHGGTIGRHAALVGLGNPGPEHAGHRHNIGFMAVDAIAAATASARGAQRSRAELRKARSAARSPAR